MDDKEYNEILATFSDLNGITILPASQYIYAEAMPSQKQEDFIHGIMNALEYDNNRSLP